MVPSGMLHWIASQAIFLARVEIRPISPELSRYKMPDARFISTAGFSTIGIIFMIPAGGITILAALMLGFRKYRNDMTLAGSCSAAIAAACHPRETEEENAVLRPLMWGDTGADRDGVRHLVFSAEEVGVPIPGCFYA